MKQIYLFCLLALLTLGITLPAQAFECTVTWDTPGAIVYRTGIGDSATSTPLEGTEYKVSQSERPYFFPAEGYFISGVDNDNVTYTLCTWGAAECMGKKYVNFFANDNYDGKTIHLEVVKLSDIAKDKSVTIQIENGGTFLAGISLPSSGTEFTPTKSGAEKIVVNYSDLLDDKIRISENNEYPIFSIKKQVGADGDLEEVTKYSWNNYYDIDLVDGLIIKVRVFENEPPKIETDIITLDFKNDMAKDAMEMIYSRSTLYGGSLYTKGEDEELPATIELEDGTHTTFTWNSKDYDMMVYVDDEKVSPTEFTESEMNGTTSWVYDPDGDHTVSFAATERAWGTTSFTFEVENEEGVVFHEGTIDGPIIDLSKLTPISNVNGVKRYSVEVSLKNPKIFVDVIEGWYLLGSYYDTGEKQMVAEPANCMMIYDGAQLNSDFKYKGHKISKTSPYVIYLDASTENFTLKDKHDVLTDAEGEVIALENGYNLIYVDPIYSQVINIVPYNGATFNIYYNTNQNISADPDSGTYTAPCDENGVLHICRTAQSLRTVSFKIPDNTTKVTYHMIKEHDSSSTNTTLETFHNTLVSITPREGCAVYLDGEKLEPQAKTRAYEPTLAEHTVTFQVTKANHEVEVKYEGDATTATITPANDTTLPELTYFLVAFPDAKEVEIAPTAGAWDAELTSEDGKWTADLSDGLTERKVANAEVPTFKFSIANPPTAKGKYTLTISKGHYAVDGDLQNESVKASYMIDLESGVAEIISGSLDNATIFTIDGRLLVKKADKNAIDNLENGIYIINGKKVIKK